MALVDLRKRRKRRRRRRRRPVRPTPVKATPKPTPSAPAVDPATWVSPLPVATARERLFLNRFGTGFTQKALARLRAAGSPEAWLAQQLDPAAVAETAKVAQIDGWFAPLRRTAAQKYASNQDGSKTAWYYGRDLSDWSVIRRIYSERSLLETMTDFWSTHMHIPVGHDRAWAFRFDYDAAIREHALGSFEDLLTVTSLHPAMRLYLDNWRSVKNKPNENQGRELLELHTVGREAGYTEAMVKDCAKILSGYTVDWGTSMTVRYDPNKHTTGAVQVLDFTHANSSADGQAVTEALLRYLARHPATARRIATKLATYFVSDDPSDALIDHLANVYTESGTSIKPVLTALSRHPEFLSSQGRKVRTPYADFVATARVLAIDIKAPTTEQAFAHGIQWMHGGAQLFGWPRPDGPPLKNAAWSTASRVFASYRVHQAMAGGWWGKEPGTYRTHSSWLPASQVRFDRYVDHLCRQWLGRAADARLLKAANQAVTRPEKWAVINPWTIVDRQHQLADWGFPRLVMALLDTPDHMTT